MHKELKKHIDEIPINLKSRQKNSGKLEQKSSRLHN